MDEREKKVENIDGEVPRPGYRAYVMTFLCAIGISVIYGAATDLYAIGDPGVALGYLSNAFAVPGVLLMGLAGLIFVKRQGGFDGLSYSARYMYNWLLPQFWLNKEERSGTLLSYRDYCAGKREREKKRRDISRCFLTIGAAFTLLGILCLVAMNLLFPGTVLE